MSIPGLGGKVMARLGVAVQTLPEERFTQLQSALIDATEWVGPYDDENCVYKVAKYYYLGWWEPGPSLSFMSTK